MVCLFVSLEFLWEQMLKCLGLILTICQEPHPKHYKACVLENWEHKKYFMDKYPFGNAKGWITYISILVSIVVADMFKAFEHNLNPIIRSNDDTILLPRKIYYLGRLMRVFIALIFYDISPITKYLHNLQIHAEILTNNRNIVSSNFNNFNNFNILFRHDCSEKHLENMCVRGGSPSRLESSGLDAEVSKLDNLRPRNDIGPCHEKTLSGQICFSILLVRDSTRVWIMLLVTLYRSVAFCFVFVVSSVQPTDSGTYAKHNNFAVSHASFPLITQSLKSNNELVPSQGGFSTLCQGKNVSTCL
jgi:hypothetical protein